MKQVRDIDLQLAEAAGERGELLHIECLGGKAQHPVRAKRAQDAASIGIREGAGEVDAFDPGTESLAAGDDIHGEASERFQSQCGAGRRAGKGPPLRPVRL